MLCDAPQAVDVSERRARNIQSKRFIGSRCNDIRDKPQRSITESRPKPRWSKVERRRLARIAA